MKKIPLLVHILLLTACSSSPQVTVTSPPPTVILTPTLHPGFIAVQSQIAGAGEGFALLPDGTVSVKTGEASEQVISGLIVSSEGKIFLETGDGSREVTSWNKDSEIHYTQDSDALWIQTEQGLFVFDTGTAEWRGAKLVEGNEALYEVGNEKFVLVEDKLLWAEEITNPDGELQIRTKDGQTLVWEDGEWVDSLSAVPKEVRALVEQGMVWDADKQIVYDSDGLVQAVQLPNGEWKTDYNGALTIQTKEGQTISFPLYADGQSLLNYVEQTDIIRDDKDIVVKGGPWVSDRTTRADISFSPDLQRVDDVRRIIYVQYGSDGTVSVQYKTQPNFHWLDNLQSFFVFDLFEHVHNDGFAVSWVAIPLPGKEEIVFVLGGESEVFAQLGEQ